MWVRVPKVVVDLPYSVIEKIIKKYPGSTVEDAVRQFILDVVGGEVQVIQTQQDLSRVQRLLQDMVNPFTAKVDEVARRLSDVVETLDSLSERVKTLEEEVRSLKVRPEAQVTTQQVKEVKKSAIDVLRDQKVMFEKDIASKIRNRDAFFDKLRREGAVVLEAKGQRIAVEPNFWNEFKEKLEGLTTNNESEVRERLGKAGYNLLKTLWEGGVIYYDSVNKKWRFTEEVT